MNRLAEKMSSYRQFTESDGAEIVAQIVEIHPEIDLEKPRE